MHWITNYHRILLIYLVYLEELFSDRRHSRSISTVYRSTLNVSRLFADGFAIYDPIEKHEVCAIV